MSAPMVPPDANDAVRCTADGLAPSGNKQTDVLPIAKSGPTFEIEAEALATGWRRIAGVDEAGRGPWAGPVVAAAVILDPKRIPHGLDDSKALAPADREALLDALMASGTAIGIGIADVDRIDDINILNATLWAMQDAEHRLAPPPDLAIVDGNRAPRLRCATRTIVRGDALSLSIAAASIVAKVTRDRIMCDIGRAFPAYGFERHKGYGTPEHRAALLRHGPCQHHRRSFKPIRMRLGVDGET